ncbi:MAG: minor capsid protein [Alphaproteobacteria bacterium]|nr:minor capsid protein [Alphaproteobacteria bacterium]
MDRWQGWHATGFTVAKSAGFDILSDIHAAMLAALQDGTGQREFDQRLIPILQRKGWWGRQLVVDPANPEAGPQLVQLGSLRRLKVIFDTNLRMAYAAGRWEQIQRVKTGMPYLRYVAVLDSKTRPEHRHWHGTILPVDHSWWGTHFPPNGWFCRCSVMQLSANDIERYGWTVSDGSPVEPEPPKIFTNPRTGEVSEVPYGIDPGFAYNPGKAAERPPGGSVSGPGPRHADRLRSRRGRRLGECHVPATGGPRGHRQMGVGPAAVGGSRGGR